MNKRNETSIVPVEVQDKARQDASRLSALAIRIEVGTTEQESKAYGALGQIKTALKTIETARKKITGPLNQSLKAANSMFKTLSEPFKSADSIIRDKILDFRRQQEEKARREQERREKIQASHEAKGHKTYDLEEVEPEVAQETVITRRWTYEVLDITKVPRKYLLLDGVAVREVIRAGEREISGLRIYQEEGLRV